MAFRARRDRAAGAVHRVRRRRRAGARLPRNRGRSNDIPRRAASLARSCAGYLRAPPPDAPRPLPVTTRTIRAPAICARAKNSRRAAKASCRRMPCRSIAASGAARPRASFWRSRRSSGASGGGTLRSPGEGGAPRWLLWADCFRPRSPQAPRHFAAEDVAANRFPAVRATPRVTLSQSSISSALSRRSRGVPGEGKFSFTGPAPLRRAEEQRHRPHAEYRLPVRPRHPPNRRKYRRGRDL